MSDQKIMIDLQNVSKWYQQFQVLTDCTTQICQGEVVVVCGPSGSGKSTLIKTVNGLEPFQKGQIFVDGVPIADPKTDLNKLRSRVGMVFQHFELFPHLSVTENLTIAQIKVLGRSADEAKKKGLAYLDRVGLSSQADKFPAQLSGGQQQRVAIARALTQAPDLLLADEPVASLDPATCHTVMDYLRRVNQELGLTIVCNLHFLSLVRQYATRVIALKGGKLVYEGSPSDINDQWFSQIYGEGAKEVHIN
jgi:glutamate/aspartate transport system ATP-binding protein